MDMSLKKMRMNYTEDQLKKNLKQLKNGSTSYKCEKCRDLTFIIKDNVAYPCECQSFREAERILKNSGISEEFRKKTFENFDYARDMATISAFTKANEYVSKFDGSSSVMFLGQVGSGKTHLSMAIANRLMDSGVGVLYMNYRDAMMKLKQNMLDEVYYQREMGRYRNCRVLLIDDLFKGRNSDTDLSIIYEILNYRYFNRMPVIVSCEKDVDGILGIDEAIGSRLVEMCGEYVIELKGKKLNYRMYGDS